MWIPPYAVMLYVKGYNFFPGFRNFDRLRCATESVLDWEEDSEKCVHLSSALFFIFIFSKVYAFEHDDYLDLAFVIIFIVILDEKEREMT